MHGEGVEPQLDISLLVWGFETRRRKLAFVLAEGRWPLRLTRTFGSDLPVVVSLEVHAHSDQQAKMVAIMQETWKDLLVPALEHDCIELPSPKSLRRKILVKVKGAKIGDPEDPSLALTQTVTEDTISGSDGDEDDTSSQTLHRSPSQQASKTAATDAVFTRNGEGYDKGHRIPAQGERY